jgi:hypothetical protein
MWILRLVRNFALLAVLALAAHAAAGADNRGRGNPHCGGPCSDLGPRCPKGCVCGLGFLCVPNHPGQFRSRLYSMTGIAGL